jgi:proline dehydrogenase
MEHIMSLWQRAMIRLARSRSVTGFMQNNAFTRGLASRFVGGVDAASAISKANELKEQGIAASLFYLGEYVESPEAIEESVTQIIHIVGQLGQAGLDLHVSVDPTQIGYSLSDELGEKNALRIGQALSEQKGNGRKLLMLDMEDFSFVQRTLDLRSHLSQAGCLTAITIQAYLRRSEQDTRYLIQSGVDAVRLVKGAFVESKARAWTTRQDIDDNYIHLAGLLLSPEAKAKGVYPIFATHDDRLIDAVASLARENGYSQAAYEFEMLYGVRTSLQEELVAGGYRVRLYLPYGTQWWPYTVRRIGENPANARFVLYAIGKR